MFSLIAFAGRAGCGKDSAANHVIASWGHIKYSLATPIKASLNRLYGWREELWENRVWKETPLPECGFKSPREMAQWLGTEAGRDVHGEECWTKLMEAEFRKHKRLVVPDVRFVNELRAVRNLGGVCVYIDRPDAQPVSGHSSERSLPDHHLFDAVVMNTGGLDAFINSVDSALRFLDESEREYLSTTFGPIA